MPHSSPLLAGSVASVAPSLQAVSPGPEAPTRERPAPPRHVTNGVTR